MNKGKIKQIIGSVLDIEFENGELPEIYNALEIETIVSGKKKRSSPRSKPISEEKRFVRLHFLPRMV